MKIYLAGKIAGDHGYREKFQNAQAILERDGVIVLNPANNPEGLSKADYMRLSFSMIDCADEVTFLPDAEESAGAQLERLYCEYIGKPFSVLNHLYWPNEEPVRNKPLTLDELRKMDGEPVWTVTTGLSGSGRWELCTCETVCACPLHKVLRCVTADGEVTDYDLDTYGKTWLAYRQKPEERTE